MSPWILLRGLTRESGHWGPFPELLRERLAGADVIAVDLPGNGRLNTRPSPSRIEAMTHGCREQLGALGIGAPYRLLAMSLGAMVAVDWAHQAPQELGGCVLINTSLRGFSPWHWRLQPANYARLLGLLLARHSAREREAIVLQLTTRLTDATVIDAWTALREQRPVSAANALRQLLAALRYRPPAAAPVVPLLVLASQRDGLVDPRCSRELAHRWGASIAEHPSAGHDLPLDDGPWVAEQVARWSQRHR